MTARAPHRHGDPSTNSQGQPSTVLIEQCGGQFGAQGQCATVAPLGTGHVADQNAGSSKLGLYFTLVIIVRLATGNSTHPRTHSPSTMGSSLKGYWGVGNPLYGLSLEMYWPFWASDTDQSLQPTVNVLL